MDDVRRAGRAAVDGAAAELCQPAGGAVVTLASGCEVLRDTLETPVDLLIIEDAETLTEADLLKLSLGHAQRCVLTAFLRTWKNGRRAVPLERTPSALLVAAGCWNRPGNALGGDAEHWPHAWRREQGRLCCQLMPLSAEDLQHLESECLVDAADIELGILHRPQTRPCLRR